tara:strand:+ start:295 stop:471 length:177 start_codon:yes stop_codon:yes gene_type:complete
MFDLAFDSINEIVNMDGHGIYVWSVYLIAILIIIVSFVIARKRIKNFRSKIDIKNASS